MRRKGEIVTKHRHAGDNLLRIFTYTCGYEDDLEQGPRSRSVRGKLAPLPTRLVSWLATQEHGFGLGIRFDLKKNMFDHSNKFLVFASY